MVIWGKVKALPMKVFFVFENIDSHKESQTLQRVVSLTFWIVQILVHLHFDLVSWLLALEATEPVSQPVTQMAVKHSSHFRTAKE